MRKGRQPAPVLDERELMRREAIEWLARQAKSLSPSHKFDWEYHQEEIAALKLRIVDLELEVSHLTDECQELTAALTDFELKKATGARKRVRK